MPSSRSRSWRSHAWALAAYVAAALLFTWPLPQHLGTHVTGSPTGDTGVYLWNIWVFQHELLTHHQFPLFTSTILSLDQSIDLALHNYTVFADVIALPFVRVLGLVTTFNLVYLALTVLTAYGCFLLAWAVAGPGVEAWLAGLAFAWSPSLVARGTAHFSLVAAAPLPVFVLFLLLAERTGHRKYMIGAGLTVGWAGYCDPYYAVYCVVLASLHLIARSVWWTRGSGDPSRGRRRTTIAVDAAIVLSAALTGTILASGGGTVQVAGIVIRATGLYTPVLLLTALCATRLLLLLRPVPHLRLSPEALRIVRLVPYAVAAGLVVLAPIIVAMTVRILDGRYVAPQIFWRTSTPGVDLLSFVAPNPSNPVTPGHVRSWIASLSGGFEENVASIPWIALVVIGVAVWRTKTVLSRYWFAMALGVASLALGPFVRIAGINTYVPTPWSLLRYLPVIGSARAPARFTALVMMAIAILFALALKSLSRSRPSWRPAVIGLVSVLLIAELWPAPRPLFSAAVPRIYDLVAATHDDLRMMELPFGIRDGLSSTGDFNASSQFYQSRHGKPLIGGYLSRVSPRRIDQNMRRPVLRALALLSQGKPVPADLAEAAARRAPQFVRDAHLGYIVVDRARVTPALLAFAIHVFNLEMITEVDGRSLYRPKPGGPVTVAQKTSGGGGQQP